MIKADTARDIGLWILRYSMILSVVIFIAHLIFGGLLVPFLVVGIGGSLLALLMGILYDILDHEAWKRSWDKKQKEWIDGNYRSQIFRILKKLEIV
jgi:membrane associated rhomboid family serine protease